MNSKKPKLTPTNIAWTEFVWNPMSGCTKLSAGCANCYAADMAKRLKRIQETTGKDLGYGDGFAVTLHPERLEAPLNHKKGVKIFVTSMGDLFHESVPFEFVDMVFAVMALTPQHTYQILTKRPDRMKAYMDSLQKSSGVNINVGHHYGSDIKAQTAGQRVAEIALEISGKHCDYAQQIKWESPEEAAELILPLSNVWLGVTVENQEQADKRIPILLETPAAVRFVSAEPMLSGIDLGLNQATCSCCKRSPSRWIRLANTVYSELPFSKAKAEVGVYRAVSNKHGALSVETRDGLFGIKPGECEYLPSLDWVIVGGETGSNARPMNPDWVKNIQEQCEAANVPFFFKQWGEYATLPSGKSVTGYRSHFWEDGRQAVLVGNKQAGHLIDGIEYREYPDAK